MDYDLTLVELGGGPRSLLFFVYTSLAASVWDGGEINCTGGMKRDECSLLLEGQTGLHVPQPGSQTDEEG